MLRGVAQLLVARSGGASSLLANYFQNGGAALVSCQQRSKTWGQNIGEQRGPSFSTTSFPRASKAEEDTLPGPYTPHYYDMTKSSQQAVQRAALFSFLLVGLWSAGASDWMVTYATSVAQLGVWITLTGLVSFHSIWVGMKRQPFEEFPKQEAFLHWTMTLKP